MDKEELIASLEKVANVYESLADNIREAQNDLSEVPASDLAENIDSLVINFNVNALLQMSNDTCGVQHCLNTLLWYLDVLSKKH